MTRPVVISCQSRTSGDVRKTARKRVKRQDIEAPRRVRYSRGGMGRPPQPPRSYVTRHIRFRRVIDAGVKQAAKDERRGFNDLVQLIVEDWLKARAEGRPLEGPPPLPPRRPRQPRKPPG